MADVHGGETRNKIRDSTVWGPVLQGRDFGDVDIDVTIQAVVPAPVALDQLPAPLPVFTGRGPEVAALTALLDPTGTAKAVVVCAVAGLAGVGKTALAVQAAHIALQSGWFPGGVLFINLHGYEDPRVEPDEALRALLRALGTPPDHIPLSIDERAALYRSQLAKRRNPVLLIADNASSEAQVNLLMPGPGPHRVVVTSRHTLAGLHGRLLDVRTLDHDAGVALLDAALRVARPEDDRVRSDPQGAVRLAKICGGLPLALQIAAAQLKADPTRTLSELADQLTDEMQRLNILRYDDGSESNVPSVEAAFELSYRQLDETAARVFRLLPVNPGPDLSTDAIARLANLPPNDLRSALSDLVKANLIEPAPGATDHWRMHDLLRLFAKQLSHTNAIDDQREQAQDRLFHYYLENAADWLAEVIRNRWRMEATARRIVTPAPVTVRWRWAADQATASRLDVSTPPAPGTEPVPLPDPGQPGELLGAGVITRLHDEVYAKLPHGRLALVGAPGAGKTGAMILLMLAALDRRAALPDDQRAQVPVPVWLSLGGWDPAAQSLQDWVVATMERDYPALRARAYGTDAPRELLREGRVALFLDGLDEMAESLRALALKRLDEVQGLRVVLTSRPEAYRRALEAATPDNMAVIELRPVRPDAAAAYLMLGQTGPAREQWQRVGVYLRDNPDSVVARALDNPLTLSLARDSYTSRDPTVLTDPVKFPTVEAVREHLIDHLLVTAYPNDRQREHAIRWLAWIAHHMRTSPDLPWWDIPGWIPRWKLRLTRGLIVGLAIGLAFVIRGLLFGQGQPEGVLYTGLGFGFAAGLIAGSLARIQAMPAGTQRRHVPPQRREFTGAHVFVLVIGLMFGLVFGVSDGLVAGVIAATTAWLIAGLAFGLQVAFASLTGTLPSLGLGVSRTPQTLTRRWPRGRELPWIIVIGLVFFPVQVPVLFNLWKIPITDSSSSTAFGIYRADRRASIIYGLVYAMALGILAGLTAGHAAGLVAAIVWGLAAGGATWLTAWLVAGQVPLVKLSELILLVQRRDRVHFLRLLEDALSRQVLRQAGSLYQFRHAALQARLAAIHDQHPPV